MWQYTCIKKILIFLVSHVNIFYDNNGHFNTIYIYTYIYIFFWYLCVSFMSEPATGSESHDWPRLVFIQQLWPRNASIFSTRRFSNYLLTCSDWVTHVCSGPWRFLEDNKYNMCIITKVTLYFSACLCFFFLLMQKSRNSQAVFSVLLNG